MTTHYAPNPERGLTMCNLTLGLIVDKRDATTDWGLVDCRECKRGAALNSGRRVVHHITNVNLGTDCGARAEGADSIQSNFDWKNVTCWDCIDRKPKVSDVGQSKPRIIHHFANGEIGSDMSECGWRVRDMTSGHSLTVDWSVVTCPNCKNIPKPVGHPTAKRILHKINTYTDKWTWCGVTTTDTATSPRWEAVTCKRCLAEREAGKPTDTPTPVEHDKAHTPAPAHQHDCEACVYLDTVARDEREHDIYFCPGNSKPTIVVRFSPDGPDYYSGLAFADKDTLIALGVVQALKRKLIRFEDVLKFL